MARILHVDNEPDTLELVKTVLEGDGHDVELASNGFECLEMLKKKKFDLVLLDIMMPDLSGWDVFARIRKTDKKIKVAFLSVLEISKERLENLRKEGVSGYIPKPFDNDLLCLKVRRILEEDSPMRVGA